MNYMVDFFFTPIYRRIMTSCLGTDKSGKTEETQTSVWHVQKEEVDIGRYESYSKVSVSGRRQSVSCEQQNIS